MNGRLKFGILTLVVVIVLSALIQMGQQAPIDWRKNFHPAKKTPYGTYVLRQELAQTFDSKPTIKTVNKSLYTYFETEKYDSTAALLFVGNEFSQGETGTDRLLQFVNEGGTAFIASQWYDKALLDSLNVGTTIFNAYETGEGIADYSIALSLYNSQQKVVFDKVDSRPSLFNRLPDDALVLGNMHTNKTSVPIFIQLSYGKGTFFIHLIPDVFTNYYLLQEQTYPVVFYSLKYLEGKNILWYDGLHLQDEAQSPLRFILTNKGLRSAWYLLLTTLLVYLIFKSRREQRAIPIITPEENKSVEFAKTIGSLYYENGQPENMVQMKIDHFLFELRRYHQLDTSDILAQKFITQLSLRMGKPVEEVREFMRQMAKYYKKTNCTLADLKAVHQQIETFKKFI